MTEQGPARRVGRKMEFPDRITLPLAAGWVNQIDAVLDDDEARVDLIRDAIWREVKRRERINARAPLNIKAL